MSNLTPPTLPYSSASRTALQSASAELAQTEAFKQAEERFSEPTPEAPNTDSSGNSRVQEATHQDETRGTDGHSHEQSTSETPHSQSDFFQSSAQQPQAPTRQSSASGSGQNASNAAPSTASQPATSVQQSGVAASAASQSMPASAASTSSQTRSTSASSGPDAIDTSARPTLSNSSTSAPIEQTRAASDTTSATENMRTSLDASMAQDLASIAGANQTTTVRIESLGNSDAMTRELLKAIAEAGADPNVKASPETQAALASLTQKTVDNIPHMLVENDEGKGVKLFVPDSHMANQIEAAEAKFLASDSNRIQAAAELLQGPDWPHMMLEAMAKASALWESKFPNSDNLQNAMMSLYGREVSVAHAGQAQELYNRLASLSNPPLNLPVAGLMHNEANQLTAFSVQQTHLTQDGHLWMTVLDMPASLEAGHEVYKTMQAEQFAKVVYVLVVPDGRPAVAIQKQHEADLNTLGLIGCCLTANGGGDARHGASMRASATRRHGSGLLENRCVTCARAQLLCQPKLV